MKFRIARHTNDLKKIIDFYCNVLELKVLGQFSDHDNYDGVFLGIEGADWHLEFTVSDKAPQHHSDNDDLLVFYLDNKSEVERLQHKFNSYGIAELTAENPYWSINGITYPDPDGYRIVITKK